MPNNDDERPRVALGRLEWGVIVSLLISAGTTLFSAGIVYGDVREQDRRLSVVEARTEGNGERLARIEANLDFLVSQFKNERAPKE